MFMLAQITTNIGRKLYSELSVDIYIVCCAQAESKRGEKRKKALTASPFGRSQIRGYHLLLDDHADRIFSMTGDIAREPPSGAGIASRSIKRPAV
jgi:hypothetical protein